VGRTANRIGADQQRSASGESAGAAPGQRAPRRLYVSVRGKFAVAQALALSWLGMSVWLSLPWVGELASAITILPAILSSH
jgi:hypothetical protein